MEARMAKWNAKNGTRKIGNFVRNYGDTIETGAVICKSLRKKRSRLCISMGEGGEFRIGTFRNGSARGKSSSVANFAQRNGGKVCRLCEI